MKKLICIVLISILATVLCIGGYCWRTFTPNESYENFWKTNRTLPDKIAIDAYLAGNIARNKHDVPRALESYAKVLNQDSGNTNLLKDFYVLALFQGSPELTLPFLDKIPSDKRAALFSDYLNAAQIFLENPTELVSFLKKKKHQKADEIICPLFLSWLAAKNNDKSEALKLLQKFKQNKQLTYMLGYQEFLLGSFFDDEELKEKGFQKIQEKKLPALGYFPLLKAHAEKYQPWKQTMFYQQFAKMEKLYSATAEFIQFFGQKEITAELGLSEILYFLSIDGTLGLFSKEEIVFLNSISLLLQPDKKLALIWGGELMQSFNFPYISLGYYDKIPEKSATLVFKKAMTLILDNQKEKAQEIMNALEKENFNYVPLLTLMGKNYMETKKYQEALNIYNRLIPLLENAPQNKPLAEAYIARANLYQHYHQEKLMISDLKKAQILMPDDPMLKNDIGYHYLEIGQINEGFELINKAHQERQNDPYILDSLAFAYFKKDQPVSALPFAEKALNLRPQNALINMHLGDIYQAAGRLREAKFQYKKALDLKEDLTPELEQEIQQKLSILN